MSYTIWFEDSLGTMHHAQYDSIDMAAAVWYLMSDAGWEMKCRAPLARHDPRVEAKRPISQADLDAWIPEQ